jgi:hypothetical protein
MKIGIDFDNTIVCYDSLFHVLAQEQALIDPETPISKGAVRDALRAAGHEESWIALQGEVYGARITEAPPFAEVQTFLRQCQTKNIPTAIISHKTRHPFRGPQYDLHAAARNWLAFHGFTSPSPALVPDSHVFLELTQQAKLKRIATWECDFFIDDLPEFLQDPDFPAETTPILFDPGQLYTPSNLLSFNDWQALCHWLKTL